MEEQRLRIGSIYFTLNFEDDDKSYPVVYSYEYMGQSDEGDRYHIFRFVGTGDTLQLGEQQLFIVAGVDELTRDLRRWAQENPDVSVL